MWTRQAQVGSCPTGAWVTKELAVACAGNGVIAAYQLGTGRVAWTWHAPQAPGSGLTTGKVYPAIDQMSANTDNGIGVFDYTYGQGNAGIVGIDIATGRQLWELPPSVAAALGSQFWESGGRFSSVMADRSGAGAALQVRSLATGALDWSSASRNIPSAGCDLRDNAITGSSVYAVTHCTGGADQLYQMSLQTGSVIAQAALHDGSCKASSDTPTLWATTGYVLSGCSGTPALTPDVVIIPAGGVQQRALPWAFTGANDYILNLSEALSAPGIAISGSTLYIGQSLLLRNNNEVDQIAAINLTTARLRWYKTIYWGEQSTNRHSEIQGVDPNNALFPVNVIGASPKGVIDLIESVGGSPGSGDDSGSTGMTLALLSASNGSISYGPGTTYPAGIDNQPSFTLAGGVLLSFPACPAGDCSAGAPKVTGTVTAYSTASWPG
jgi:PQQ-like domain